MSFSAGSDRSGSLASLGQVFSKYDNPADVQSTVIIGAGIIGCSTAYYLSHSGNTRPDAIHLIDISSELFESASGKAAGFIAGDWFEPQTASLGALSFKLHKELAEKYDGRKNWGYSPTTAINLKPDQANGSGRGQNWLRDGGSRADVAGVHEFTSDQEGPAWLIKRDGDKTETITGKENTAQVDPLRLCRFLLRESVRKGVRIHNPVSPIKISRDETGALSAIRVRHSATRADHKIPCTRLLITAGAWTSQVFDELFPYAKADIPVTSLAGHSLVVKSPRWRKEQEANGCHALFTTMGSGFSPEIYSRLGEELYISGVNDANMDLPELPEAAKVDDKSVDKLKAVAESLLTQAGEDASDLQIIREGLCFRPVTENGSPILSVVADGSLGGITTVPSPGGGVFVSAGHGPWGISLGVGTGKVMAEMMEGEPLSADISALGLH